MSGSIYILAVLCGLIVLSEWLVRKTPLKHIGTALLVILLTALFANTGIIPAGSTAEEPVAVYDFVFSTIAPLAIFLLLLPVNLRDIMKAGLPLVLFFFVGSIATAVGVFVAMWVVDGPETIGPMYNAIAGMFVGTYVGGSVNFNTLALHYDVVHESMLYTGSIVVDNIMTTVWMIVTLAIPRAFAGAWMRSKGKPDMVIGEATLGLDVDTETLHPMDLGILLGLGFGSIYLSDLLAEWLAPIPSALILTVIALGLAQSSRIARIPGARLVGMFAVYLFLAVIGAFADIGAMSGLGSLGITLLIFTSITVFIHGLITYGAAYFLKVDPVIASIASQANVGGGTSALALARSLGREDLVLPSILLGSLGYAVGTFLGFWVAENWMLLLS